MHPSPKSHANEEYSDAQPAPYGNRPIAPGAQYATSQALVPWSTGLFDCCSDRKNCCLTCCFPCVTFGQIAEIIDEGTMPRIASTAIYAILAATTCHACIYAGLYRQKLRNQYRLEESPCNDYCVHCCCEYCALCQEYRELQNRGYDMMMGWQGDLQRNYGVSITLTPPTIELVMKQ
ncbi:PREDICTED: cell number regulator 1-like [Lupinus angustifolius]|uniref:cell number regulator 1-like n=1 Tax=Lupinus angustifolius TaxID=3871 RepID=UPI00092ECE1F|nr:PREDICTED: cell number regulator 1-like [Lupinus angustifolius]XP_019453011.1 PREDICTED: cell number regulator 1-like [Lupinus angustifolius]